MGDVTLESPVVIVSPHLDDAVLSCSEILATYPGTRVISVLAGAPQSPHRGYNSRTTGRDYAPDAVALRREEDRAALAVVDAAPIWLDLLDKDYESFRPAGDYGSQVEEALESVLNDLHVRTVVIPLGLWHDDHVLVAEACLDVVLARGLAVIVYLDLPYGLALPQLISERLGELRRHGTVEEVAFEGAARVDKRALMRHYRSQYKETRRNARRAFARTMRGGERYWRLTGSYKHPEA